MTHQMIRRFAVTGEFTETKMPTTRDTIDSVVSNMMRDEGYVPLFDVAPVFRTDYRGGERYLFTYTAHGVFVGRQAAWQIAGILDGKPIPYTQPDK